jgi:hypothetical protein
VFADQVCSRPRGRLECPRPLSGEAPQCFVERRLESSVDGFHCQVAGQPGDFMA